MGRNGIVALPVGQALRNKPFCCPRPTSSITQFSATKIVSSSLRGADMGIPCDNCCLTTSINCFYGTWKSTTPEEWTLYCLQTKSLLLITCSEVCVWSSSIFELVWSNFHNQDISIWPYLKSFFVDEENELVTRDTEVGNICHEVSFHYTICRKPLHFQSCSIASYHINPFLTF